MANAKRLPSGSYRVQVFIGYKKDANGLFVLNSKGKKIAEYESFTHEDKDEAVFLAAQFKRDRGDTHDLTVKQAITKYIQSRKNVLSPSTIQGYEKIRNNNLQSIMDIKIKKLTQDDIQQAVNTDALSLKAKTIKNAHGLLAAALNVYKPRMRLCTSLPSDKKRFKELPLPERIFEAVRGTDIELPVLLAMWLSFSKSEIRGINKKRDIKDGVLTLNKSVVDVGNKAIEKDSMKEYDRSRRHVIPAYIMSLIDKCPNDYIVTLDSYAINYRWRRALEKHNIPHIPFHDLRHVNASVMHLLGIPDKYAMERGGWKTDQTMKAVYQNVFTDERKEVDKKVDDYFDKIVNPV